MGNVIPLDGAGQSMSEGKAESTSKKQDLAKFDQGGFSIGLAFPYTYKLENQYGDQGADWIYQNAFPFEDG